MENDKLTAEELANCRRYADTTIAAAGQWQPTPAMCLKLLAAAEECERLRAENTKSTSEILELCRLGTGLKSENERLRAKLDSFSNAWTTVFNPRIGNTELYDALNKAVLEVIEKTIANWGKK